MSFKISTNCRRIEKKREVLDLYDPAGPVITVSPGSVPTKVSKTTKLQKKQWEYLKQNSAFKPSNYTIDF